MKSRRRIFISILVFFLACFTATAGSLIADDINETLDSVSAAITEGKLDTSIEKLQGIPKSGLADKLLGRIQFLMGKAKYIKVSNDIGKSRSEGKQDRDELKKHQTPQLEEALEHFKAAYSLAPESDWAQEALYATGLVQDYGFLQRFDKAAEAYKFLSEKYPNSPLGQRAAQRMNIFRSMQGGGAHGGGQK
jgi:tetratricopeptide (TPR) repeat protein